MAEFLDRYVRQLLIPGFRAETQRRLFNSTVTVIGAGGLGSAVLLYLAAAGVGRLVVFDYDKVELSNLNRQILYSEEDLGQQKAIAAMRFLNRFNPDIAVDCVSGPVAESGFNFGNMDIIVDATDNFEARYYLNRVSLKYKKPLIYVLFTGRRAGWLLLFLGRQPAIAAYNPVLWTT